MFLRARLGMGGPTSLFRSPFSVGCHPQMRHNTGVAESVHVGAKRIQAKQFTSTPFYATFLLPCRASPTQRATKRMPINTGVQREHRKLRNRAVNKKVELGRLNKCQTLVERQNDMQMFQGLPHAQITQDRSGWISCSR